MPTYDQPTAKPTAKVSAATGSGALAILIVWLVGMIWKVEVPEELAAAIATLLALAGGYFKRERVPPAGTRASG